MYLLMFRLFGSLTTALPVVPGLGSPISVPRSSDLAQVNVLRNEIPWDRRLVALTWSALYQVSPSGSQIESMVVNCGKGRKDCARVWVSGKPGYGCLLSPAATTAGEPSCMVRSGLLAVRSSAASLA